MQDIQQRLLATFQIEHRDHVEQIRALLTATRKPGVQPSGAELEEAFRRAHSLKGAARAVDLRPIEGLAHRLETLFARVRQGECTLDGEVTGVLHQVLDASEDSIAALAENRTADTVPAALRAIEKVLGMVSAEPAPEPIPEVKTAGSGFQPVATVRITAQSFDGLFRTAGGLTGESRRQDQVGGELSGLERNIALLGKESERVRRCAGGHLGEISRLMPLIDSMERQLRVVSRQARRARHLHHHSSWSLRQLGKQLQRDVWQARMVPAESLLEGCRRMVRDLARDEGKEIEFRAVSTDVRADRSVLEALKDPIMHLLRNAVSHGIESGAERAAKGKNRAGVVTLGIDANGQGLSLTVQDDGRGVDRERVAEVALREGIISEADVARRASAQELTRILFRPGFSTAAEVTNISGRGMGLSVVYEAVRRLQGDLDLKPAAGGGTIVHISAPLSIATGRFVIVESGGQFFAVPLLGIERLTRVRRADIGTAGGKPVIVFNDQQMPLAGIHGLLGLEAPPGRADREMMQVVILRSGSHRVALGVDRVLGETDAVIQDLGAAAGCGGRISSGVVLDDGSVAFPVNPMELIESALDPQWKPQAFPAAVFGDGAVSEPAPEAKRCSILVVDDSMTTRALEKSILEAHGYHVRLAVDGMEALERLRAEAAQLVIADIEMPRLNGFGLIEAMKQDRELRNIPVIIVSSVERREDQERGLALGADAYIVKRKFDQAELLAAIRQIL